MRLRVSSLIGRSVYPRYTIEGDGLAGNIASLYFYVVRRGIREAHLIQFLTKGFNDKAWRSLSSTSWSIVRRGELMFNSAPRGNNAHRHMKTSDFAGRKSVARSRQKATSRTWGPIGGERLKRDLCFFNFLTTKR
ncbi:hypothetical protein Q8A73_007678 [Channa argus]|nr:hypothetical protein Q8A73_007678 [Channa argus]